MNLRNSSDYIVNLVDAIRNQTSETAILVFSYMDSKNFAKVAPGLDLDEMKYYLY